MTATVSVKLTRFPHGQDMPLPAYATAGSAGVDLPACVDTDTIVAPGKRVKIPTGMAIELPENYEAQVRPRSGLALKQGLTVLNTPGTIDSDYRGEIQVILINLGEEPVVISRGMRIAQMVIAPVTQVQFNEVSDLSESKRAAGGFGSTGT